MGLLWSAKNHDILPKVPYTYIKIHVFSRNRISTDSGLAAVITSDVVAKLQVRILVGLGRKFPEPGLVSNLGPEISTPAPGMILIPTCISS